MLKQYDLSPQRTKGAKCAAENFVGQVDSALPSAKPRSWPGLIDKSSMNSVGQPVNFSTSNKSVPNNRPNIESRRFSQPFVRTTRSMASCGFILTSEASWSIALSVSARKASRFIKAKVRDQEVAGSNPVTRLLNHSAARRCHPRDYLFYLWR